MDRTPGRGSLSGKWGGIVPRMPPRGNQRRLRAPQLVAFRCTLELSFAQAEDNAALYGMMVKRGNLPPSPLPSSLTWTHQHR